MNDSLDRDYKSHRVRDILGGLNQQQRAAVTFDPTKALQVIAGPGTGKTKVLTSRVAYLILHYRIDPRDIIVTTFTNKAAKEMKDRLAVLLENTEFRSSDIMIGTFHSICLKILARFGSRVGLQEGWRIVDEKEIEVIMTKMIENMPDQIRDYAHSTTRKVNLCLPKRDSKSDSKNKSSGPNDSPDWDVHQKLIKKHISRLKSSAILPQEYKDDSAHDSALSHFYELYQDELFKLNALDFDDLLMFTFRLLTAERCLPFVQHVFVDEFQDTNSIQIDLMFLLARGNHHISRGITVVGDPDQSIYAFRYALAHNFQEMSNKCPLECSRVILVENYRSSQKILDTSETLIKQQQKGREQRLPLKAQFTSHILPVYMNFPAYFLEAPSIAREILYLKSLPNLFSYDSFAILVRKRRQIRMIEKSLIEYRIPYQILRGRAFWELKEIMAMLNIFRIMVSENDEEAIISSLSYPSRGFGDTSAERLREIFAKYTDKTKLEILNLIAIGRVYVDIPKSARGVVLGLCKLVEECNKENGQELSVRLVKVFDLIYEKSGLKHEFLFKDGKKKGEIDIDGDPNLENPRHKNIQLLRSYFVDTEENQDDSMINQENTALSSINTTKSHGISLADYILQFLNSLSLFAGEKTVATTDDGNKGTLGTVTVCTIHGSKGLEWPVVFIPGCEDNNIPAIFSDDKDNTSDNEEEGDGDNKEELTNKKSQNNNVEESIDEERRMFFVAQTRAKYLLYLSSVTDMDAAVPRVPSRFLTQELLKTTAPFQKALVDFSGLKKLYNLVGVQFPTNTKNFSLSQLIKDYKAYIDARREKFYWGGNIFRLGMNLDLAKNVHDMTSLRNEFTTASEHLKATGEWDKHVNKMVNNDAKKKTKTDIMSKMKQIKKADDISSNSLDAETVQNTAIDHSLRLNSNIRTERGYGKTTSNNHHVKVEEQDSRNSGVTSIHDNAARVIPSNQTTCLKRSREVVRKRLIKSEPIDIVSKESKCTEVIKLEDNDYKGDEVTNKTASELLHNPSELKIDNRPIIASAKILADAARKSSKLPVKQEGIGVKKEMPILQDDIFSQLNRAKKKAKLNDSDIIVID